MYEEYGITITVLFSEDAIYGDDPDAIDNVDTRASTRNYESTLAALLEQQFPGAEVTVEKSINNSHRISGDDASPDQLDAIHRDVGEIIHDHWRIWDWVVRKSAG